MNALPIEEAPRSGSPVLGGRVGSKARGKGKEGSGELPLPKPSCLRAKVEVSRLGRVPSRAAVTLHVPETSASTYAEVVPEDEVVSGVRSRPSASDGVILEVPEGLRWWTD